MKTAKRLYSAVLFIVLMVPAGAVSAEEKQNFNEYYYSPFTAGVYYSPLSGIANRSLSDFDINEVSAQFRFGFEKLPKIKPFIIGGMETYTFTGNMNISHQDWSHTHIFAGLGLGYTNRISKEFEMGIEGFGALSQSVFSDLSLPGVSEPMGQLNILGGAQLEIVLNPSFNISIGITPTVRYLYGLGELDTYNGFTFGVGFGGTYRFGQDPDAPQSAVRAIQFVKADIPSAFAAMQSFYVKNPVGSVVIKNTEKYPITNIDIGFMQPGFMDSATPSGHFDSLAPGESIKVPVLASYNTQVFTTQGVTPLTGEIIVQYTAKNRPVEQRQSVTYDLYDKNALTWDDDRKVAAFITPQDSAIRNYASFIRQADKSITNRYLNENLQFAMQTFEALSEFGIMYQIDPTSPFTKVQEDTLIVDSISLPRETLVRSTGDCDDLTTLYNTILQTVGIETAFVTIPGHIFSAFNTGIPSREYKKLYPDRSMTLNVDGTLWVLVEITLIGRSDFLTAWRTGITEYSKYDSNPSVRGFNKTTESQKLYRPVALRETDLGLQYGSPEAISKRFKDDLSQLDNILLKPYRDEAEQKKSTRAWNTYGIQSAKLGSHEQATYAFNKVLNLKPDNLNAKLNLGSLYYLMEKYTDAEQMFKDSLNDLSRKNYTRASVKLNVLINLSKTNFAMQHYPDARKYFDLAKNLDPAQANRYSFLAAGSDSSDTGRASKAEESEPILFFEE